MKNETIIDEVIQGISIIYREKLEAIQKLKHQIIDKEVKLQDDKILHNEYIELKEEIRRLVCKKDTMQNEANGIYIARERVFDFTQESIEYKKMITQKYIDENINEIKKDIKAIKEDINTYKFNKLFK